MLIRSLLLGDLHNLRGSLTLFYSTPHAEAGDSNIKTLNDMKKIFAIVAFLSVCSLAWAQGIDTWIYHPSFGQGIQNVIDTGDDVYYLADGNLFRYEKESEETEPLFKGNYLNDSDITGIYFDYNTSNLVITYANSDIDAILPSHEVVNMPQIQNYVTTLEKDVNDVTFSDDGLIFVATNFGYVVFDQELWEVKESHFFSKTSETATESIKVLSVAVVGEYIVISTDDALYYGSKNKHFETLSELEEFEITGGKIFPISSSLFFFNNGYFFRFSLTNGSLTNEQISWYRPANVQPTTSGFVASFPQNEEVLTFNEQGTNMQSIPETGGEIYSSQEQNGDWWALGVQGLHKISGEETSSYVKPNCLTISKPFYMTYNASTDELLVTGRATNALFGTVGPKTIVNSMKDNFWTDVTPSTPIDKGGNYRPVIHPADPHTYFLPTWQGGIYKITDGEVAMTYDYNNSPMVFIDDYYCHPTIAFDPQGNLWVAQTDDNNSRVMVLPKAKIDMKSVSASDWIRPNIDVIGNKRSQFVITSTGIKVFANGDIEKNITIWDDGGNPSAASVKKFSFNRSDAIDQDNKRYEWKFIYDLAVDKNNRVWMASSNGVVSFDPAQAFGGNFYINRTKVPRNDGTNLADYLLDGQQVNCIAVDGSNRKWIGTNSAGVFLVNYDGSEILKQFSTANSNLPSDRIFQICCNPNSNSVYFTTDAGMAEYRSDAVAPQPSFSNILVYPNPVRPEFTGDISITGLMDNTLVKIADVDGNVVASTKSNGGLATWNGCNYSGKRVKTGVYFVIVSQSNINTSNEAAVAKILVIN